MTTENQFTEREREVVQHLLQGMGNKQIAISLGISRSTVEFHLKNIYLKLGVRSRTEAVLALSKRGLGESVVAEGKGNLGQSVGDVSPQKEYGSHARHFFNPKEEKAMRNRTVPSITLSVVAILAVGGLFAYWRLLGSNRDLVTRPAISNSEMTVATRTPRVLYIPPVASTRSFDEVFLMLQSTATPFHYAAIFAGIGCFIPGSEPCNFTTPIVFPEGESLSGHTVYWTPDGEDGLYVRDQQILVLNHLERHATVSDALVPDILKTDTQIHLSPDGRWMVESVQVDDPYASDLVLIKPTTGRVDKLDIGLEKCFKSPLGWLTPSKFLFRCDISMGATSKKFLTEQHYYTYDVLSEDLLRFGPEIKTGFGFDALSPEMGYAFGPLSPNGRYIVFTEKQGDLRPITFQVKDLSSGLDFPLNMQDGQIVWSHDSSKMAIFTNGGDIYVCNPDGSNRKKIYSSKMSGYMSLEWFPDDQYIALVGCVDCIGSRTEMIILSENGKVINYDPILTTYGYNIIGISPLPAVGK